MTRYLSIAILGLALIWSVTACSAPKVVGPTPTKGYFVSLQVLDPSIYVVSHTLTSEQETRRSRLVVRVQNAQGRPVDGVPVDFELAPNWVQYASVTPSHATTRNGMARAFFKAEDIGPAPITVRVNGVTQEAIVVVEAPASAVK